MDSISKTLALTLLLMPRAVAAAEASREVSVLLLAGQSNMVGLARIDELGAEESGPQARVLFFEGGEWRRYEPRYSQPEAAVGLGPEVTAGRAVAEATGATVGIVKVAVGGTNLYYDWNADRPGSLYQTLRETAAEALRKLREKGLRGRIGGVLWMQGESDAVAPMPAAMYGAHLARLIQRAREDAGDPELPFVLGRITPSPLWPYAAAVRAAQEAAARGPNARFVNTDDLPRRVDLAHYDTRGITELGRRLARGYLELASGRGPRHELRERLGPVKKEKPAGPAYREARPPRLDPATCLPAADRRSLMPEEERSAVDLAIEACARERAIGLLAGPGRR